jgi:hypothetical protein
MLIAYEDLGFKIKDISSDDTRVPAGGQPFRAAPDFAQSRLKLAGVPNSSVCEGFGF